MTHTCEHCLNYRKRSIIHGLCAVQRLYKVCNAELCSQEAVSSGMRWDPVYVENDDESKTVRFQGWWLMRGAAQIGRINPHEGHWDAWDVSHGCLTHIDCFPTPLEAGRALLEGRTK